MCVQRFDDSLDPAIRITYRVSRRSSSLWEPRDPSLKDRFVVLSCVMSFKKREGGLWGVWGEKKREKAYGTNRQHCGT